MEDLALVLTFVLEYKVSNVCLSRRLLDICQDVCQGLTTIDSKQTLLKHMEAIKPEITADLDIFHDDTPYQFVGNDSHKVVFEHLSTRVGHTSFNGYVIIGRGLITSIDLWSGLVTSGLKKRNEMFRLDGEFGDVCCHTIDVPADVLRAKDYSKGRCKLLREVSFRRKPYFVCQFIEIMGHLRTDVSSATVTCSTDRTVLRYLNNLPRLHDDLIMFFGNGVRSIWYDSQKKRLMFPGLESHTEVYLTFEGRHITIWWSTVSDGTASVADTSATQVVQKGLVDLIKDVLQTDKTDSEMVKEIRCLLLGM